MQNEVTELLTEEEFWELIAEGNRSCQNEDELVSHITKSLSNLELEKIYGFEQRLDELMKRSYLSDLWCTAFIACGGCSDDGFDYFRAWLIGQGRDVFYNALENPDSLLSVFDQLKQRDGFPENELILYVAAEAYEIRTGNDDFYEQCPYCVTSSTGMVLNWSEEDEESMKIICPKVFEKYWGDCF